MADIPFSGGSSADPRAVWASGSGEWLSRMEPSASWDGFSALPGSEGGEALSSVVQVGPVPTYVFADSAVVRSIYERGTVGLMPDMWGVLQEADQSEEGSDFIRSDAHENVYAAGVTQLRHVVTFTARMPVTSTIPEIGDKFYFRGDTTRQYTVWAARVQWTVNGKRQVSVIGRWYHDLGNLISYRPTSRPPQLVT